jgi:5'(3')-deoxyribonucleotidase
MRQVIKDYTGSAVQLAYEDVVEFNYYECQDKNGNRITKDDWKKIHQLFSQPKYLWRIEPIAGAIEGLREVAKRGTIHIATARIPPARKTTVEWLEHYCVPIHDLHFLRHGEKHASLRPFTAAAEDDYAQAVAFSAKGGTRCFLLRHPWNASKSKVEGVEWVNTWEELAKRFLQLCDEGD